MLFKTRSKIWIKNNICVFFSLLLYNNNTFTVLLCSILLCHPNFLSDVSTVQDINSYLLCYRFQILKYAAWIIMNGTCIITLCYRRCWRSQRDSTVSGCSVRSEPCSPDSSSCRTQRWRSSWPTEVRQQTHTHARTYRLLSVLSFFLSFVDLCFTLLYVFVNLCFHYFVLHLVILPFLSFFLCVCRHSVGDV